MDEFDEFWNDILDMLKSFREMLDPRSSRMREDVDIIINKNKKEIYITFPLRSVKKIKSIHIDNGKLVIIGDNEEVFVKEIELTIPIKKVKSYSLKNGILDIVLGY